MTTYTITTTQYLRDLTGKTGVDTLNINGGTLIVDCDSRYAPNSLSGGSPVGGTLGNLTVDASLGGRWQVTTEFTKLIPFSSGSGTVPTYGTTISRGAASGVLLCVMATKTGGATYAGGAAMPATGWIKIAITTPGFTTGALTGISASATATEEQGWIIVVGEETRTHSHARLGSMQMRGDTFTVGTTNGAVGQTLQLPHFTATTRTDYPGVDIETAPGSGVYQFFPNAGTRHTSANSSTDTRSSFVYISTTGLVSIGRGADASTCGYVPVSGCKVRIPTIVLQNCALATPLVNVEPSRTMGSRYESSYVNAGSMDVRNVTGAWYWNVLQPYGVYIRDMHVCDNILLGECATAMDIDNLHQGLSTSNTDFGSNGIVLQQSYNGGTIGSISWLRALATVTSAYAATMTNLYGGWTIAKARGGHVGTASAVSGALYLNTNGPIHITEIWTFTKRLLIQAADNARIDRMVYADNNLGTTPTTASSRAIETVGQCKVVDIAHIENWPGVANCHPYLGLLYSNTTQQVSLRYCGTAAAPYNAGSVNLMAYIFDDGGNNDIVNVQRNWTTALRFGLHGGTNTTKRLTSVNNYQVDASKTIGPPQLDSIVHGNRFNSGAVPTSYSSVYGTCQWDGFTGDTTTRAALILVEKSAANPNAYEFTGGTPKFTGAGRAVLAAVGDQITWLWPWRILGWTGLTTAAIATVNSASHLFEYAIDTAGAGFGAWKTLTSANLAAETGISPTVGLGLKVRATCTVAGTTNRLDSMRIDGTTTLALQNAALYPLDVCELSLTGLVAGSTVAVFGGTPTPGQTPLAYVIGTGTTATLSYDFDSNFTSCTVRVRKPGYDAVELPFTNSLDVVIPVAQQENRDGFGVSVYDRGLGTTNTFVTLDAAALRIDIGNSRCGAEDVYDTVADWQATATGIQYPEALRFDGTDMLILGSWRFRRKLSTDTGAGIDALPAIDGSPTGSPDDEANGSVDFRARSVRTYQVGAAPAVTAADLAAAVWNYAQANGSSAESNLLSARTAAEDAFAVSA